jgi:hypothetical protein
VESGSADSFLWGSMEQTDSTSYNFFAPRRPTRNRENFARTRWLRPNSRGSQFGDDVKLRVDKNYIVPYLTHSLMADFTMVNPESIWGAHAYSAISVTVLYIRAK